MEETSDTLRLAEEERAKQGIHELEFSFGGERDLHTHFQKCQKNPGHREFTPVKKFNACRLPKPLATDKIIAWIKSMSQLTVKLSVKYVSPNRPDGFLLWNRRGQRVLSVGSRHVTECSLIGDTDKMPCPFTNCADLPGNHEVYGYITIATAAHVVFDDEEAKNTTVEFFYDDHDDKSGVVTARGVKVRTSSIEGDFCELMCVTHDIFLIRQLKYNLLTVKSRRTDYFWYKEIPSQRCTSYRTAKLSVNYVSPHRPPGQRVESEGSGWVIDVLLEGNIYKLTCPFTNFADFPRYELQGSITIVTAADVVFDDEEAKNTTVEFFYYDLDGRRHTVTARGVKVRTSIIEGDVCELLCVTRDTFLIRQLIYNLLTTNSRHQNYMLEKIVRWPICKLHHTAKLFMNYVSPNRPPGYPLSDRAGQRVVSVGSGCVIDVSLEGNTGKLTCPFTNCADLTECHKVCGYITILTAAHVVFDDEEAKNTTVKFFYNDADDRRHVVTARGMKVRTSSIEGDVCRLLCVTYDTVLIRHLKHNLLTVEMIDSNYYLLGKMITWPRCKSHHTAKLSVNYVSPNRPPGYPLSERAGQRVVSVGSGCVIDVSLEGNNGKLPCPFTNCADLTGCHEVCGYITIVTAVRVVFDDEEAKNTTVEFFYDGPDDRRHVVTARGVKVRTSSIELDFCQLLCVTHDTFFIRQLPYNLLTVQIMESNYYLLDKILTSPRCMPHHTAKLSVNYVNYVSPKRPPGYPLSDRAGQRVVSVGSGRVIDVSLKGKTGKLPCPFTDCADLPGYHEVCGYITILTAAHVVFDDEEAKNTIVEFFYDGPDDIRQVVTARGVKVRTSNIEEDFCELVCVTHGELFGKLKDNYLQKSMVQKKGFWGLFRAVLPGLESTQCESTQCEHGLPHEEDMTLVHIGHPHGQSKHITIGRQTDCFTGEGFYHQLYTAPTCPGCSGGPVWMIPASGDLSDVYGVPHSGHYGNELNKGCSWTMYPHKIDL